MTEARAETMHQEGEDLCAALQYAASFHLLGRTMEGRVRKQTGIDV